MSSTSNRFDDIAKNVREKTNQELSDEISSLVPLSAEDISKLFPTKADKEHLSNLMSAVAERTNENERVAHLVQNINSYGTVVVRLLRKIML